MPLDTPDLPLAGKTARGGSLSDGNPARVQALNRELVHHAAADVLRAGLEAVPDLVLVSSFGAESVALLHLVAMVDRDIPVFFIDTEMLFTETMVYQQDVAERLGLRDLTILRNPANAMRDPSGLLHRSDPDACCALRKTEPLERALAGRGGWITGRKRFHSGRRAALDFFEVEPGSKRVKINPLAHWTARDVADYIAENRLPRHPLVERGYLSIGCAPCTSPVADHEDIRAGRWRDTQKDECGIHFAHGKAVRTGEKA